MKYGSGFTKPYGHYTEIKNLQRGLNRRIIEYKTECGDDCDGDPDGKQVPRYISEAANRNVPKADMNFSYDENIPIYMPPVVPIDPVFVPSPTTVPVFEPVLVPVL